jgi:hypothetical protein
MQLITSAQRQRLLENGRAQRAAIERQDQAIDVESVVVFRSDLFRYLSTITLDPRRPGQTPPSVAGSKSPTHATG